MVKSVCALVASPTIWNSWCCGSPTTDSSIWRVDVSIFTVNVQHVVCIMILSYIVHYVNFDFFIEYMTLSMADGMPPVRLVIILQYIFNKFLCVNIFIPLIWTVILLPLQQHVLSCVQCFNGLLSILLPRLLLGVLFKLYGILYFFDMFYICWIPWLCHYNLL